MLTTFNPAELPRALQHILDRDEAAAAIADAPTLAQIPRRSFLKIAGAGSLALGVFPAMAQAPAKGEAAGFKPTEQPASFVEISPSGEVTVAINRLEFGQGVHTALPLVLAEELAADWSKVRARLGGNDAAYADPRYGIQMTGGSTALKHSYTQYRELGARARAMLVAAAAAQWKVDAATLRTRE
ncbi:MAG TPA: carbon monoxide dehydrogenase, partial [Delftia acidovorans]|nr:carbon monoxide dehydrogenase [Delftia acidovorans]